MKYTCSLRNLEFFAYHGVYGEENIIGGRFIAHIEIGREVFNEADLKTLDQVYNYEVIYNLVHKNMTIQSPLIETVAKRIFDDINQMLTPDTLEVTIIKPNPAGLFKSGEAAVILRK